MNTTPTARLYGDRDPVAQGKYFLRHMDAMTAEGLHSKAAIAEELAHRDILIDQLQTALAAYKGRDAAKQLVINQLEALNAELVKALQEVKAVLESNPPSICDTVWVTGGRPESLYDFVCSTIAAQQEQQT